MEFASIGIEACHKTPPNCIMTKFTTKNKRTSPDLPCSHNYANLSKVVFDSLLHKPEITLWINNNDQTSLTSLHHQNRCAIVTCFFPYNGHRGSNSKPLPTKFSLVGMISFNTYQQQIFILDNNLHRQRQFHKTTDISNEEGDPSPSNPTINPIYMHFSLEKTPLLSINQKKSPSFLNPLVEIDKIKFASSSKKPLQVCQIGLIILMLNIQFH